MQGVLGTAHWQAGSWKLRTAVDASGVHLFVSRQLAGPTHRVCEAHGKIAFAEQPIPAIGEMFIRGKELHLGMPQDVRANVGSSIAGLEVVILPIQSDEELLVVETTLSLQTQWLDVEPTVVIQLPSPSTTTHDLLPSARMVIPQSQELAATQAATEPAVQASLLIDSRDIASMAPSNSPGTLTQFFGEFMEKGVIRKVQPWWIWTTSVPSEKRLEALAEQLSRRPLPLAS